MRKILIAFFFLIILFNNLYSMDAAALFNKIREKNDAYMPKSFTAVVNGAEVNRGLASVSPHDRLGRLYLLFMFHKEYGERLLIKNATDNQKNMFAAYLAVYNDFKVFLKKDRPYSEFTATYSWEILRENAGEYQVKMRKKRNRAEDYFLLHVDKKLLLINTVAKFTGGRLSDIYRLNYIQIGKYRIIQSFSFNGIIQGKRVYVSFYFSGFKLNVNLTESEFYE